MSDLPTNLLLSLAVFAGAFVSGLAGFAFSAVAGAILLRIFQPLEAVPLMMACSVGVQAANLWALRRSIEWRGQRAADRGRRARHSALRFTCCRNADTHYSAGSALVPSSPCMPPTCCSGRPSRDSAERPASAGSP